MKTSLSLSRKAGFSVVETLCGMTLMFVGLLSLASSTVTGMTTRENNRENAVATHAARELLEQLQVGEIPFEDLFTAYTLAPAAAIAPDDARLATVSTDLLREATRGVFEGKSGNIHPILARQFEVTGLEPRKGASVDSMGSVSFPVASGPEGLELREDIAGRDLNGDGVIDGLNHAGDYKILPVTVKIEWKGQRGVRQLEVQSLLIRR